MFNKILVIVLLFLSGTLFQIWAVCDYETKEFDGHIYGYVKKPLTWDEANDFATQEGGYLAVPDGLAENNFFLSNEWHSSWIGIYDPNHSTNFCFDISSCSPDPSRFRNAKNNGPVLWSNWLTDEPNNFVSSNDYNPDGSAKFFPMGEHWVVFDRNGFWGDIGNHGTGYNEIYRTASILEFDTPPDCYDAPVDINDSLPDEPICSQDYDGDGVAESYDTCTPAFEPTSGSASNLCNTDYEKCEPTYVEPACPSGGELDADRNRCQALGQISCPSTWSFDVENDMCIKPIGCTYSVGSSLFYPNGFNSMRLFVPAGASEISLKYTDGTSLGTATTASFESLMDRTSRSGVTGYRNQINSILDYNGSFGDIMLQATVNVPHDATLINMTEEQAKQTLVQNVNYCNDGMSRVKIYVPPHTSHFNVVNLLSPINHGLIYMTFRPNGVIDEVNARFVQEYSNYDDIYRDLFVNGKTIKVASGDTWAIGFNESIIQNIGIDTEHGGWFYLSFSQASTFIGKPYDSRYNESTAVTIKLERPLTQQMIDDALAEIPAGQQNPYEPPVVVNENACVRYSGAEYRAHFTFVGAHDTVKPIVNHVSPGKAPLPPAEWDLTGTIEDIVLGTGAIKLNTSAVDQAGGGWLLVDFVEDATSGTLPSIDIDYQVTIDSVSTVSSIFDDPYFYFQSGSGDPSFKPHTKFADVSTGTIFTMTDAGSQSSSTFALKEGLQQYADYGSYGGGSGDWGSNIYRSLHKGYFLKDLFESSEFHDGGTIRFPIDAQTIDKTTEYTGSEGDGGTFDGEHDACSYPYTTECPGNYKKTADGLGCYDSPNCPVGSLYNRATNRCESTADCPAGSTFNSGSGNCEAPANCPSGSYNPVTKMCEVVSGGCQAGENQGAGICWVAPTCPSGYSFNGSACEKVSSYKVCQAHIDNDGDDDKNGKGTCQARAGEFCFTGGYDALWVNMGGLYTDMAQEEKAAIEVIVECTNDRVRKTCPKDILNFRQNSRYYHDNMVFFDQDCNPDLSRSRVATFVEMQLLLNKELDRFEKRFNDSHQSFSAGFDHTETVTDSAAPSCPAGYNYDGSGKCYRTDDTTVSGAPPVCPAGMNNQGLMCYSTPGCSAALANRDGSVCYGNASCSFGGVLNTNDDLCHLGATVLCPPGASYNAATDTCLDTVDCGIGVFNKSKQQCEIPSTINANTCPNGYEYTEYPVGKCESWPLCTQGTYIDSPDATPKPWNNTMLKHPVWDMCYVGDFTCPYGETVGGQYACMRVPSMGDINHCSKWQCTTDVIVNDTATGATDKPDDGVIDDQGCQGFVYIFGGRDKRCVSHDVTRDFGTGNCCNSDKVLGGLVPCDSDEVELAYQVKKKLCHQVGDYCSRDSCAPVVGCNCLQNKNTYCCFNSVLARIFNEQARPQIGLEWGTPKEPMCRGFEPEEFEKIDFAQLDLSEYDEYIQENVPSDLNDPKLDNSRINIENDVQSMMP